MCIRDSFFAPYLLNKTYSSGFFEYDGSPLSYQTNNGGGVFSFSNGIRYYDSLLRGIVPARLFLNLSNTDEYGQVLTDDWLIIPKDHLINNYSIPLLDLKHFFPGQTPSFNSSNINYFNSAQKYFISQEQLNDPTGLLRYSSSQTPYMMFDSYKDLPTSTLSMSLQIVDHTKLSLIGGLSNYNAGSYHNSNSLKFFWTPTNKDFLQHLKDYIDSSNFLYEVAIISLFAIDRVVSYRV